MQMLMMMPIVPTLKFGCVFARQTPITSWPPWELPALRTRPAPTPLPRPPTTDASMRSSTIGTAGTGMNARKAEAMAIDMSVVMQNLRPITL